MNKSKNDIGIYPDEGVKILDELLHTHLSQVIVSVRDLHSFIEEANVGHTLDDDAIEYKYDRIDLENEYVEPQNHMQKMIANHYSSVLGIRQIGIEDNFFDMGGDSLLAVQIVSRLKKQFDIELPLSAFMTLRTVKEVAAFISQHNIKDNPNSTLNTEIDQQEKHINQHSMLSLAPIQKKLYMLNENFGTNSYLFPVMIKLTGKIDYKDLEKAISYIIKRHCVMRSSIVKHQEKPYMQIVREIDFHLDVVDVESEKDARSIIQEMITEKIRLETLPLYRMKLIALTPEIHIFVLVIHHIIFDGWSKNIFFRELCDYYERLSHHQEIELEDLEYDYNHYAIESLDYEQTDSYKQHLQYWINNLKNVPLESTIESDYIRKPIQSYNGKKFYIHIEQDHVKKIRQLAKDNKCSMYVILMAIFQLMLHKFTRQETILIGTPVAGRDKVEYEKIIGFFANTRVIKGDFTQKGTFRDLLEQTNKSVLKAMEYGGVSLDAILQNLDMTNDYSKNPLFQIMLILHNFKEEYKILNHLQIENYEMDNHTSKFDITMELYPQKNELSGWIEYNTDLFRESSIENMFAYFTGIMTQVLERPDAHIDDIRMSTPIKNKVREKKVITNEINQENFIIKAIEEQAQKDHTAIFYEGKTISYQDIETYSNIIAGILIDNNMGISQPVISVVERSPLSLVVMLGIWKAGCVYIPIDPEYPESYITDIIRDVGPTFIFYQNKKRSIDILEKEGYKVYELDSCMYALEGESSKKSIKMNMTNNAYILYTSGSSGKPKGVLGYFRGLRNRCHWMWEVYPYEEREVACHKTALSFVDSLSEILCPLLKGIPSVVLSNDEVKNIHLFVERLAMNKVTRITLVPSVLNLLLTEIPNIQEKLPHLKYVISSGERLSVNLYKTFKKLLPKTKLLNLYGSTECSGDSTYFDTDNILDYCKDKSYTEVGIDDKQYIDKIARIPIGKPITGHHIYILDQGLKEVLVGVVGEIFIGGVGVNHGYTNNPKLTSERFINLPHIYQEGFLYRTGDYGRYLENGYIEYFSRIDKQIKVNGVRIEIEPIESAILRYKGTKDVALITREGEFGSRLICFVEFVEHNENAVNELKKHLANLLPSQYIPSTIIVVKEIMYLTNGKVDSVGLLASIDQREHTRHHQPLETDVEKEIAIMWADILNKDEGSIDKDSDFFMLGGNSLYGMQMLTRVNQCYEIEILYRDFVTNSTLYAFAQLIDSIK